MDVFFVFHLLFPPSQRRRFLLYLQREESRQEISHTYTFAKTPAVLCVAERGQHVRDDGKHGPSTTRSIALCMLKETLRTEPVDTQVPTTHYNFLIEFRAQRNADEGKRLKTWC